MAGNTSVYGEKFKSEANALSWICHQNFTSLKGYSKNKRSWNKAREIKLIKEKTLKYLRLLEYIPKSPKQTFTDR